MRNNKTLSLEAPRNSPRAHFPFPTNGRWASLGTRAFPWPDAEMAAAAEGAAARARRRLRERRLLVAGGRRERVRRRRRRSPSRRRGIESVDRRRRRTKCSARRSFAARLAARAFRDGDVFVCVSAPPRWEARGENGFAACRPGVLWRQERVRAEFSDESATRTRRAGDTNDTNDAFGRTLPLNTLGDVRGNVGEGGEGGARFVRQLATERASLRGDATGTKPPRDPRAPPVGAARRRSW